MGKTDICKVPQCLNSRTNSNLTFFKFPKEKEKREVWCKSIGVGKENVGNESHVCELHFQTCNFKNRGRTRLKLSAIPSAKLNVRLETPITGGVTFGCTEGHKIGTGRKALPLQNSTALNFRCRPIQPKIIGITTPNDFSTDNSIFETDKISSPSTTQEHEDSGEVLSISPNSPGIAHDSQDLFNSQNEIFTSHTTETLSVIRKRKRAMYRLYQENRRLKQRLEKLKPHPTIENLTTVFGQDTSILEIMKSQWERYTSKTKKPYSDMEKVIALTLYYKCGRQGYKSLISLGFKLPCKSSISRWLSKFNFRPGLNSRVLSCVEERVKLMNSYERDCALLFDEMYIKKYLIYNKCNDEFEGIQDHGSNRRELVPATEVLVVLIRGINTNWIFPFSFYFSEGSTDSSNLEIILKENLKSIFEIGLKVRVCVCDMGFPNQGLYRRMAVSDLSPFIMHNKYKVYCVFDTPHLIKLIRTHIERHGFGDGSEEIIWNYIKTFYELDSSTENRLAPRLSQYHFNLTDMSRMKVKLATQVLSNSVAAGIKTMVELKKMPTKALQTSHFIKKLNDMFDLLNMSSGCISSDNLNLQRNIFDKIPELETFRHWVSAWVTLDGKKLPDCVKGMQLTLHGIIMLLKDLKTEGYGFVLTRRLQQDYLEHFFSFQRSRGGNANNPTATQFMTNFKYLFMTTYIKNSEGSNCESIDEPEILLKNYDKLNSLLGPHSCSHSKRLSESSTDESGTDEFEERGPDNNDEFLVSYDSLNFFSLHENSKLDLKDENVSMYLGGWAVKSVVKKTKCGICMQTLLEFPSQLTICDIMLCNKEYTHVKQLHSNNPISYGYVLTADCKVIFKDVVQLFRVAATQRVNIIGTRISENILTLIESSHKIYNWVNSQEGCAKHRRDMIQLVVRAKLYLLVRVKNEKFRIMKSFSRTLRCLRHN